LANDSAERAAIEFAVKRDGKRNPPAAHNNMTPTLPDSLKAILHQQIAKLRARQDA
jgi:hypothetical protein